ncbi:MAG: molecular chaperone DnaJ, partial [Lachnospiraceae bacterium]|nr:molecular chaperone DnaJ [Lachnospiraceae bacterium]
SHPIFQRQDTNIYSTVPISFAVAALGGEVLIDTVDGRVAYEVKPGTQTDTRVRLKGKGVPSLRYRDVRGDHYVTLVVQTPDKLSKEAKDLLKQFDALTGDSLNAVKNAGASPKDSDDSKKKKFWK